MKYPKQFILVLVTALITFYSVAQSPSGKLSLVKGQQLQMETNVKASVSLDMMGQPMDMTADAAMVHAIEVKEKKGNNFLLNSTLTKMKSNMNAMGQAESFDSDEKDTTVTESSKMIRTVLNVPKKVELNKDAKVVGVQSGTAAEDAPAGMMQMLQGMMGGAMDDGSGAADAFLIIPAGKQKGDTWNDSVIAEGIKIYRNFTLKEINGNKATIVLAGNQITNKKADQMGMEVNIIMDAKLSGETIVDINTGIIEQKTSSMDGTGTADIMGQSLPMTTKLVSAVIIKNK